MDVWLAGDLPSREPVMSKLRRVGAVALVAVSILFLFAERHGVSANEHRPSAARPSHSSCRRSALRVVIDVGHTLDVPGAVSARGVPEYAFNLQLGSDIKQALADAGFDKAVLLITTTAPWIGLVERAMRANSIRADLFISIHHDSVPEILLETWKYEGQEAHFSDRFKGYAIFVSNANRDRAGSLLFGKFLGQELHARGLQLHASLHAALDGTLPP